MEHKKLLGYMQTLAGLESDHYILCETITKLEYEHQRLVPQYDYLCKQTRFTGIPTKMEYGGSDFSRVFKRSLVTLFLGYYIGFYPGYFLTEKLGNVGLFIAIGIYAVFSILVLAHNSSRDKKAKAEAWKLETDRMKTAFQGMVNSKLEIQEKLPAIQDRVQLLKAALASCEEALEKYYDLDILPKGEKYRGFVPVQTMLGYLQAGRTYSLSRNPNNNDPGAINMYIEELHHHQIVGELRQINHNLEIVQQRQSLLYEAYCENNQKIQQLTDTISHGIETLHRDNQIAEYSRKQIAKNTERMRVLAEYSYSRSLV